MNSQDIPIYAAAVCAISIVIGSIWLLKSGVIRLTEAAKEGAFSVEIADKIKLKTTYPALALFIIGLLFIGLTFWFTRTPPPLNLVGKINIDDPSLVTVSVQFADAFAPDSNGQLDRILPLDIRRLKVVVNAAGYSPQPWIGTLKIEDAKQQRLAFAEEVRFTKLNIPKPAPGPVVALPDNVKLEPLHLTN